MLPGHAASALDLANEADSGVDRRPPRLTEISRFERDYGACLEERVECIARAVELKDCSVRQFEPDKIACLRATGTPSASPNRATICRRRCGRMPTNPTLSRDILPSLMPGFPPDLLAKASSPNRIVGRNHESRVLARSIKPT
jgi:hypothetical protein